MSDRRCTQNHARRFCCTTLICSTHQETSYWYGIEENYVGSVGARRDLEPSIALQ